MLVDLIHNYLASKVIFSHIFIFLLGKYSILIEVEYVLETGKEDLHDFFLLFLKVYNMDIMLLLFFYLKHNFVKNFLFLNLLTYRIESLEKTLLTIAHSFICCFWQFLIKNLSLFFLKLFFSIIRIRYMF
jgi:hypothetical protein